MPAAGTASGRSGAIRVDSARPVRFPRSPRPRAACAGAAGLEILDQTLLPARGLVSGPGARLRRGDPRLAIRGAPNIGVAAVYGLAMQVALTPDDDDVQPRRRGLRARGRPRSTSPGPSTASRPPRSPSRPPRARRPSRARRADTTPRTPPAPRRRCSAPTCSPGRAPDPARTATRAACRRGRPRRSPSSSRWRSATTPVLACETRPLLQGARLTIWELAAPHPATSCSSTAPRPG